MDRAPQPPEWMRVQARQVFGSDPENYDRARPGYPERVYELLRERCGLDDGVTVLEIGPGTGAVTRRLVAAGARVVGVEPDPVLADRLRSASHGTAVSVVAATFEAADLDGEFDLVVSATAFHWVDQAVGLPKLRRALRPGGWAALWWTHFADPTRPDPFLDAAGHLLQPLVEQQRRGVWALDSKERRADLVARAGLVDVDSEVLRWTHRFDTASLRAFHASTIDIARRPADEQQRMLDELASIAEREFGGVVDRPFVTAVYVGRRPER